MSASPVDNNTIGFRSGMHTGCAGFAETALAMRLLPVAPAQEAAAEVDYRLAPRQMLVLPATSRQVIVLAGQVWLTRDGDCEDYILSAGDRFAVRHGDQAALQALQPSRVRVIAA